MAEPLSVVFEQRNLLLELYREPSITAYNRLEARARTEDFERSLRAEIRDPLWMLTRQWQMGELEAEDAGSPIDARLLTSRSHLDRVALGRDAGQRTTTRFRSRRWSNASSCPGPTRCACRPATCS